MRGRACAGARLCGARVHAKGVSWGSGASPQGTGPATKARIAGLHERLYTVACHNQLLRQREVERARERLCGRGGGGLRGRGVASDKTG